MKVKLCTFVLFTALEGFKGRLNLFQMFFNEDTTCVSIMAIWDLTWLHSCLTQYICCMLLWNVIYRHMCICVRRISNNKWWVRIIHNIIIIITFMYWCHFTKECDTHQLVLGFTGNIFWNASYCLLNFPSCQKQFFPTVGILNLWKKWHPHDECIYK